MAGVASKPVFRGTSRSRSRRLFAWRRCIPCRLCCCCFSRRACHPRPYARTWPRTSRRARRPSLRWLGEPTGRRLCDAAWRMASCHSAKHQAPCWRCTLPLRNISPQRLEEAAIHEEASGHRGQCALLSLGDTILLRRCRVGELHLDPAVVAEASWTFSGFIGFLWPSVGAPLDVPRGLTRSC